MNGWKIVGRDVWLDPPEVGASVRVCDLPAFNWVESLSQNSAEGCIHVAIGNGNYAPYGAFSGSRASDGGGIGHMSLAYQDRTTDGGGVWGHYVECFVAPDAHTNNTAFGVEYGIVNKRPSCADIDPYHISNPGIVDGVRIGVGKPGANGREISSLMTFPNTENSATSIARKGLVFASNVLRFFGGIANAVNFAMGHAICWFDQYGRRGPMIYAEEGGNADYASRVKFTNGAIHFTDAAGVHQFSFNTMTGVPYYGNTAFNPVPLPQCPGSMGTLTFYVGGRKVETPIYAARS